MALRHRTTGRLPYQQDAAATTRMVKNARMCRAYIIDRLARNRAWGGNYMVSFGPRPDGTMRPAFYEICDQMAAWMKHSSESVFDVEAGPYPQRADVPARGAAIR